MRVPKTFLFCGLIFCSCAQAPDGNQHLASSTPVIEYRQPDPATIALIDSLRSVIDSLTGNTPQASPPPTIAAAEKDPVPTPVPPKGKPVPPINTSLNSANDPFNRMSLEPLSNKKDKTPRQKQIEEEQLIASPKAKSGGVLTFSNSSHDYGQIKEGKQIYKAFFFKNTGQKPISILSADVTCGCTTPTFPKTPILPGASGKIDVHYNSNGKMASQHSVVTLYTDGAPSFKELHLRGYVMPLWDDEKPSKTPTPKPAETKVDPPKKERPKAAPPKVETTPEPPKEAPTPEPTPEPEAPAPEPKEEAPKAEEEAAPGL